MNPLTEPATRTRQPLLDDAVIALRAPTQVWSRETGDAGAGAIDGIYHGDVRHVRDLELTCDESEIEWISVAPDGPSRVVFTAVLRGLDDDTPDPKVRLLRERVVTPGKVSEIWTLRSARDEPVSATLRLRAGAEFASLHDVKGGAPEAAVSDVHGTDATASARSQTASFILEAAGGVVETSGSDIRAAWSIALPARGEGTVSWRMVLDDTTLVVRGAARPTRVDTNAAIAAAQGGDPRLGRWLEVALGDLDALRLTLPDETGDAFYAAGAPWFFTLFGRDSLWAARLALPLDVGMAASTLRVLARLQGDRDEPDSAQEPGKILHELRATTLEQPGEGIALPPLYYGTVDATALWVCLLADARRAGMPEAEVAALVPALRAALRWLVDHGDNDGDGFIDYLDRTGHGLANQGWKDSGDSIQWRDGRLAEGPIALCEVQGYAYEAALAGAEILEGLEGDDEEAGRLRTWAADLRERFAASYWVDTPEGRYPAVALDRHKQPVDTLTSNIGHLLGTGILDADDEAHVARLLLDPSLSSGFGIRTMSTGATGYWPLSYHGGSVWTHDTAIAAHGMLRAGLRAEAEQVVAGLLAAAEAFSYRVPELHSGDPVTETSRPAPYPAACRPQAWSAAAAVVALTALQGR
ncbi:glycogen debranching N-terminal domain-containing protein [Microbacterium sp. ET2]|uniref:glycogen debranching N-terminal domain-containing protein n=1 Tax=Microbacterium albipurpureum TaxID=3050384 RepID=UPI00259CED51|nr:glycogen debranching N-terminal domain-containing protein [Microbacterium sp. ET2 (Ac-2212)]WJL96107.1 glycogen debranching N-terminal domain-containing protein [Microbacterium sp. ET2 (Ac-2212)]